MALTRSQVETILVGRLNSWLVKASMSVANDGSNADLNDPIGWALRTMELSVADVTDVTDSDLSVLSESDYNQLFDLAEYRTVVSIYQHLLMTDERLGPHGVWASQFPTRVGDRISALMKWLELAYGYGKSSLDYGTIKVIVAPEEEDEIGIG